MKKSSMVNHLFVILKAIKFHTIKKREYEVGAGENTQQDIYPALFMFPFNGPDIHPDQNSINKHKITKLLNLAIKNI